MSKVAAVGFCCADVYPDLNRAYPTGNGVDFCIHLSRSGIQTAVVSVVGTDLYGEMMQETLLRLGVDTSHLHVRQGATCQMMMELRGNDRVHCQEIAGVMADFTLSDEDIQFIKTFDTMHTDLFGRVLHHLPMFKASGMRIVMDFSTFFDDPEFHVTDYLPFVDYAFCSYDRRDDYIEEFMQKAQGMGPEIVTVTLGENGSISYNGERYYEYGIIPTHVVNTVGAGDAYIAGFMLGIMKGWSIPACMVHGASQSKDVISKFDPY